MTIDFDNKEVKGKLSISILGVNPIHTIAHLNIIQTVLPTLCTVHGYKHYYDTLDYAFMLTNTGCTGKRVGVCFYVNFTYKPVGSVTRQNMAFFCISPCLNAFYTAVRISV